MSTKLSTIALVREIVDFVIPASFGFAVYWAGDRFGIPAAIGAAVFYLYKKEKK